MADRCKGLLVAFDSDLSEEHAEALAQAIRWMRNVAEVSITFTVPADWHARTQVRCEIGAEFQRLWKFVLTGEKQP
mgnify:CR=1 FL=1